MVEVTGFEFAFYNITALYCVLNRVKVTFSILLHYRLVLGYPHGF